MGAASRRVVWAALVPILVGAAAAGGVAYRVWPRAINLSLPPCLPEPAWQDGNWVVRERSQALLADVADFRDELQAYLYYEYLRSHARLDPNRVLLHLVESRDGSVYRITLDLPNDILGAYRRLDWLESNGYIHYYRLRPALHSALAYERLQTAVFDATYRPVRMPALESLTPAELMLPVARFLAFKSVTDRRVRERIKPVPEALDLAQALRLSSDVIQVTRFYSLPLDQFLGIGAMENNYMAVRGDLDHRVWKRHAQPGDVIVARRRGRVLVQDDAIGVWQITRQTLRYAHWLYLHDTRDYSKLSPRLRPPRRLDFSTVSTDQLTTYAGLLLRNLLDRTRGDLAEAVGAYNGGINRPNFQYAEGVAAVASYARSFLERSATFAGRPAATNWMMAGGGFLAIPGRKPLPASHFAPAASPADSFSPDVPAP